MIQNSNEPSSPRRRLSQKPLKRREPPSTKKHFSLSFAGAVPLWFMAFMLFAVSYQQQSSSSSSSSSSSFEVRQDKVILSSNAPI